jgi:hypothetical protein
MLLSSRVSERWWCCLPGSVSHCSGYAAHYTIAVRRRAIRPTDCLPLYLAGPRVGMCTRVSLLAAAAFLSARFCFSVLPDFLLLD